MDINNPLEDIKVEAALHSEEMKLAYRLENKPKDVNILDYTVIEALKRQIPMTVKRTPGTWSDVRNCINCLCPQCGEELGINAPYCDECGQALEWEEYNNEK